MSTETDGLNWEEMLATVRSLDEEIEGLRAELAKAQKVTQAASDFTENVKRHNIAGAGEWHTATDASFRVLRAALDAAKEAKEDKP